MSSLLPISPIDNEHEPGVALSSDELTTSLIDTHHSFSSPYPRAATSSPGPRLPGYIPGMLRPMTPRDGEANLDPDDQTPSTTPRATSPRLPGSSSAVPSPLLAQTISSNLYRSNSNGSVAHGPSSPVVPPLSTSPLFVSRSTNGRFTPEDRARNINNSSVGSSPVPQEQSDSPLYSSRRRPTSPLASPAYQPLPAPNIASSSSRPSTPSNVTWLSNTDSPQGHVRNGFGSISSTGRSRSGSTTSFNDPVASSYETDQTAGGYSTSSQSNASATTTRPTYARDASDSPSTWYDRHLSATSLNGTPEHRSSSALSSAVDPGSPARPFRSPTLNHVASSPISATFVDQSSRRTSRQNTHSSFALSPGHALLLSPIGNSSRSSLDSAGSSYHSWDEDHKKDRFLDLFTTLDSSHMDWHDLSGQASTSQTTPNDSQESYEETVRSQLGLTKSDVLVVQDKLVSAAATKAAAAPEGRHRANSLRRRRPSTSQSNYSFAGAENRVSPSSCVA
jgi:serine/arginine repetitive matrix protein 2